MFRPGIGVQSNSCFDFFVDTGDVEPPPEEVIGTMKSRSSLEKQEHLHIS